MQVRARGEARVAGVGEVLSAGHMLADAHLDRVPVQVGVDGDRAVIVEDLDDVGLVEHRRLDAATERVVTQIHDHALACGVDGRAVRQADIDRVQAVGSLAFEWNNNVWRGSILIPIDSLNPLKGFKRVYGVGVDAVINAKL